MPPGDPMDGYASTRHLGYVPGWQPAITVAEGAARYVRWLKDTPAAVPPWLREEARVV